MRGGGIKNRDYGSFASHVPVFQKTKELPGAWPVSPEQAFSALYFREYFLLKIPAAVRHPREMTAAADHRSVRLLSPVWGERRLPAVLFLFPGISGLSRFFSGPCAAVLGSVFLRRFRYFPVFPGLSPPSSSSPGFSVPEVSSQFRNPMVSAPSVTPSRNRYTGRWPSAGTGSVRNGKALVILRIHPGPPGEAHEQWKAPGCRLM